MPIVKGAFEMPTLRDVALTTPYIHHGSYITPEQVVDHYDRGGDVKGSLSPIIVPLKLSAQDKADLVTFLKSPTGAPETVAFPQLPQ